MFDYSRFYRIYTQHLRKYYEVSQQNLAKAIQIPNSSLSKIEAGKQEMDEKTFKKVIVFSKRSMRISAFRLIQISLKKLSPGTGKVSMLF